MQNKKGFSFIELMLLLVFFFLVLAALMPMITRRHLSPAERVGHGLYACYRNPENNRFKETLIRGTHVAIDDREVERCRFEAPRRANYFYVQLIGGGGAGHDLQWGDIDQRTHSEYRLIGQRDATRDNYGYFVQDNEHFGWQGEVKRIKDKTDYENLIGCSGGDQDGNLNMYLYGKAEDGQVCSTDTSSPYACAEGETENEAICRLTNKTACSQDPNAPVSSNGVKLTNEFLYTYPCTDANNDKICDNNSECTGKHLICDNKQKSFQPASVLTKQLCTNNANTPGYAAWTRVNLCKLKNLNNFKSNMAFFTRTEPRDNGDGKSVGNCTFPKKYTISTGYNLVSDYYFTPDADDSMRAPNGASIFFTANLKNNNEEGNALYMCGGQGAEIAMPYGHENNKRRKSIVSDLHCAAAYGTPNPSRDNNKKSKWDIAQRFSTGSNQGGQGDPPASMNNHNDRNNLDYKYLRIIEAHLWQTQDIPYGVGGRAGQVRTLILRNIPEDVILEPGLGGVPGVNNGDGNSTVMRGAEGVGANPFPRMEAAGGNGGSETVAVPVDLSPILEDLGNPEVTKTKQGTGNRWREPFSSKANDARMGGTIDFSTFIRFVVGQKNQHLQTLMADFGRGGEGAYTVTNATCSYNYETVALISEHGKDPVIDNDRPKVIRELPDNTFIYHAGTFSKANLCRGYQWVRATTWGATSGLYSYDDLPDKTNGYRSGYYRLPGADVDDPASYALQIGEHATAGSPGAIVISW